MQGGVYNETWVENTFKETLGSLDRSRKVAFPRDKLSHLCPVRCCACAQLMGQALVSFTEQVLPRFFYCVLCTRLCLACCPRNTG
jgi:hypothetical protein